MGSCRDLLKVQVVAITGYTVIYIMTMRFVLLIQKVREC